MKKIKMNVDGGKTFEQGCEAYLVGKKPVGWHNQAL